MSTLTQKMWQGEYPLAIECQSFDRFVSLVRQSTVLLSVLSRTIPAGHDSWRHQWVVHLTARQREHSPILYCTLCAAQAEGAGTAGRLVFPFQQVRDDPAYRQTGNRLASELASCLIVLLQTLPGVLAVHPQARYQLPDDWVWSLRSGLDGSGIQFAEEHWVHPLLDREASQPLPCVWCWYEAHPDQPFPAAWSSGLCAWHREQQRPSKKQAH